MEVSAKDLPRLLGRTIKAGITSFIWGKMGAGKSDVVRQLADTHNLHFVDIRLSQIESVDMSGLPAVNQDRTRASYLPMDMFPIEGDEIPDGKTGFLLFLDEANQCSRSVQSAAFQLTLDRAIGQHKLHRRTAIILAGNNAQDSSVVSKLPAPLLNRLAHFELAINKKAWIQWADTHEIDYRIKSYINYKPDMLHKYNKKTDDKGYPTPRSWSMASKLLGTEDINEDAIALMSAVLGEGAAREFYSYTRIFTSLPTIEQIMKDPDKVEISTEASIQYALTGLVSHHMTLGNAKVLMRFIRRLPIEFATLTMQAIVGRDKSLLNQEDVVDWKVNHLSEFMS